MTSRIRPLFSKIWDTKPRKWATFLVSTTATFAMVHNTLLDLHSVEGPSMSPTLSPTVHETGKKDYIFTIKRNLRGKPTNPEFEASIEWLRPARATLRRGDTVTLWKPHNPDILAVKRVIGLEGDTVVRNVKRVGKQDKEGGRVSEKMGMGIPPLVVKVPPGHVWVEGDNWRHTVDSNDYGPIPVTLVTARVVGVHWPPSRMGMLSSELHSKDAAQSTVIPGRAKFPYGWEEVV